MVVDQINIDGVASIEAKDDPPISRDGDRPEALQGALQRVQPQSREIHLSGHCCHIEAGKYSRNFVDDGRLQTSPFVLPVQAFEAFVPETPNHGAPALFASMFRVE
jgi:hypothetical protein